MKLRLSRSLILKCGVLAALTGLVGCAPAAQIPVTGPEATSAPATAVPAAPTNPPPSATMPPAPTAVPVPTAMPEPAGDLVRGGLMYDKWWEVIGVEVPAGDHPLWKTQSTNTRTGADTWRCKECHGWDYKGVDGAYGSGSHKTGFAGLFASQSKPFADILSSLQGQGNADHDFSAYLDEQALIDLALFITKGQFDADTLLTADAASIGDAAQGQQDYENVCAACHGPQGVAINFDSIAEPEFVPHLAVDNPWEFIHKVRFGAPGWPMPSSIVNEWTDAQLADVLAYAQTLSPAAQASGGGLLYDAWWEAIGADEPAGDQPLWKTQTTNTRTGLDTWRCKECHGWDYQGVDGAYGSGSHKTGFPGILASASLSAEALTAWLTGQENPDHDFSAGLGEAEVAALVIFIQQEMTAPNSFINADKTVTGDPARGKVKYDNTCAACHGQDGKKLNFGDDAEPEYLGTLAADNPWEFFHKALAGQPGEPMPAARALGWSMEDIANLAAYVQTLPIK